MRARITLKTDIDLRTVRTDMCISTDHLLRRLNASIYVVNAFPAITLLVLKPSNELHDANSTCDNTCFGASG
jgi:hypothetical protein